MRIKLDENLSTDHLLIFKSFGYKTTSVHEQRINGCSDIKLLHIISEEKMFLVTLDIGFSDIRKFQYSSIRGLLLIRTDKPGNKNVGFILKKILDEMALDKMKQCIIVADEDKTRIRYW